MKKLLLAGFAMVVLALAGCRDYQKEDFEFVTRITGVSLPTGTKLLANYDNRETFLLLVLELPRSSSEEFLRASRFSKQFKLDDLIVLHRSLPKQYWLPDLRQDWLGALGRSKKNRWEFAYDPSTSRMWCVVRYPDWSGDSP